MTYPDHSHQHHPAGDFSGLGIAPQLLEVIRRAGFVKPTPIQERAIPIAVTGKDIIGIAQTGTGKTLAFGIPLIQRVMENKGHSLVVVPTRELAIQVDESIRAIGRGVNLRTAVLIGGAPMGRQMAQLRTLPQIIVGTPGRINDHLERRTLNFNQMSAVVLDEADRMLDLGFAKQIRSILNLMPRPRQTLLFSATMPADIVKIAQQYMQLPLRVEVAPTGTTAERVIQELFIVSKDQKTRLLDKLLHEYEGSILVFSRTKHGAKKLTRTIRDMKHKAVEIHGNRTLAQRRDALEGFKDGRYRILVATDIAARGIDITGLELVLNYDMPENSEDYVHRIGRTGRAGLEGRAITFVQPDQHQKVRDIERLVRATLKVSPLPELPPMRSVEHMPRPERERFMQKQALPVQDDRFPQAPPAAGTPQQPHRSWGQRPKNRFRRGR